MNKNEAALTYVAQWVGCHPATQRGHHFKSLSGHVPGLWAKSPVGGTREEINECFSLTSIFLSLSFSVPPPLSKNK